MKYIKPYNESVKDYLKPKNDEDIRKSLEGLSLNDKMLKACEYGLTWLAKEAIDDGFKPTNTDDYIYQVTLNNHPDILKMLLDTGHFDNDDMGFFTYAAVMNNYYDVVKIFMDKGVNISNDSYMDDEDQISYLDRTIRNQNAKMAELLINNNVHSFIDNEVLHNALQRNEDKNIETLKVISNKLPEIKDRIQEIYDKQLKQIEIIKKIL